MTFDEFLKEACPLVDLEWRKYRRRSARHRIDERMRQLLMGDYFDYLALVRSSSEEAGRLPDLMRVTVSRFFREQKHWWVLRDLVMPRLMARHPDKRTLKVWSAGCCGGEEPFSIAIVWMHYLTSQYREWHLEILASDIDEASLERTGRGIYRSESLREVPSDVRDRWFLREGGQWRVDARLKSLVKFEKRNILTDPLPHEMDLVLCRYLPFTYFTGRRRDYALQKLGKALRPGGVLMVGAKEQLPPSRLGLFELVEGTQVFYRRI